MNSGKTSSAGTIVLFAAAAIVFLVGVATLVLNITNYNSIVESYVAQGYPADMVTKQLLTGSLLPQIFEAVGLYFGIAFAIFGVGLVNRKVSLNALVPENTFSAPVFVNNADYNAVPSEQTESAADDNNE